MSNLPAIRKSGEVLTRAAKQYGDDAANVLDAEMIGLLPGQVNQRALNPSPGTLFTGPGERPSTGMTNIKPSVVEKGTAKAPGTVAPPAGTVYGKGQGAEGEWGSTLQTAIDPKKLGGLFNEATQTVPGSMGNSRTIKIAKLNSAVEDAYKSGELQPPPNTIIENGQVFETRKGKGGETIKKSLPRAEATRRLMSSKVVAGTLAGGALATAGLLKDSKPTAEAEGPKDAASELDSLKPPADSRSPEDQIVKEAGMLFDNEKQGKNRIGAGVAGANEFRVLAGLMDRYPSMEQVRKATQERGEQLLQGLTPEQRGYYEKQLEAVRTQAAETEDRIMKLRQATLDDQAKKNAYLALGEVLESIGNNVTRLFAANYGLRKGVDLSGIRFDRYDWAAAQARYDKYFERSLDGLDKQLETNLKSSTEAQKELIQTQSKEEERMLNMGMRDLDRAARMGGQEQALGATTARAKAELIARGLMHEDRMAADEADRETKATIAANKPDMQAQKEAAERAKRFADVLAAESIIINRLPKKDGKVDFSKIDEVLPGMTETATASGINIQAELDAIRDPGFLYGKKDKIPVDKAEKAVSEALRKAFERREQELQAIKGTAITSSAPAAAASEVYVDDLDEWLD